MRYLADSRGVADHWYPADLRKRAVVDMYLDQHHSFLRVGISQSATTLMTPRVTGEQIDLPMFKRSRKYLKQGLADLEVRLSKYAYICGPEMTIADLSAACELDQGKLAAHDLSKYPKVNDWLSRMIDQDPINSELAARLRKTSIKTSAWLKQKQLEGYPKL